MFLVNVSRDGRVTLKCIPIQLLNNLNEISNIFQVKQHSSKVTWLFAVTFGLLQQQTYANKDKRKEISTWLISYSLNNKCVLWLQTSISLFLKVLNASVIYLCLFYSVTLLENSYSFILYPNHIILVHIFCYSPSLNTWQIYLDQHKSIKLSCNWNKYKVFVCSSKLW